MTVPAQAQSSAADGLNARLGPPALTAGAQAPSTLIIGVQCHNNHRVPCDTIKTRIYSKPGDIYSAGQINRDFMSLWNTQLFDDIRIEREDTPRGIILHIWVEERPEIRKITYKGIKSITESDILDRYKARNVRLTRDSRYDPTVAKQAENAIKELLAEHGRQYSTVKVERTKIPPSSVELTFLVTEGPKVAVGNIGFRGNQVLQSRTLRRSMKNLRPIGIPHSLILESLFSKTYDQAKLSEDLERIRETYQERGYFEALVEDPGLALHDTRSHHVLFWGGHPGKKVDITVPVVEGNRYKVGRVTFINNKFITSPQALQNVLGMKQGDVLNVSKLRKGLENLKKLYGQFGYINFVANPDPRPNEKRREVDIAFDMSEGKPYFIRRIEFSGNTTTRDKVIRRELLVDEGGRFNSQAWENSLLRLNQLGYFDQIKPEDAEIKQDSTGPEGHVDIDLHLKEKGKNSIGLTGGVSGLFGSFLGLNYSTNNFLGLGETLSFSTEYGALQRSITFGFTEPALFDRPIETGFTVYQNAYHYDQAKQLSLFTGRNLVPYFNALGANSLLNYSQDSKGLTVSASHPLRRSFMRVGMTYGYDISNLNPITDTAKLLFNSVSFRGVNGPSALTGIRTSRVIPSVSYSTVNSYYEPTAGRDFQLASEFAGLGGNVKMVRPSFTMRYFHPVIKNHVFGMRLLGSWVSGYGGVAPPTFDRFFTGGEDTIRGFDIMAVTPIALIPTEATVTLQDPLHPQPGQYLVKYIPAPTPTNPNGVRPQTFSVKIPTYQITFPGGDTEGIGNFEYRVPLFPHVTLAYFTDAGVNMVTMHSQLRVNQTVLNTLQNDFGRAFNDHILLASGTNGHLRVSTGLELQVMLPIIQAPFRVYYAINPYRVDTLVKAPISFQQSDFLRGLALNPTTAPFQNDADVLSALNFTMNRLATAPGTPFREAPHTFRFTIGRTF